MIRLFENDQQTKNYAVYRPFYPDGVAEAIVNYARKRQGHDGKFDLMLDVGCGTGQSSIFFHSYAKKIIGMDPSMNQIEQAENANPSDNITYIVSQAEDPPVEKHTVDLLCCASAVHWFNFEGFFKECRRVLKPKPLKLKPRGPVALYGYRHYSLSKSKNACDFEAMKCLEKLKKKCIWHERTRYPQNKYSAIFNMIPSQDKCRIDSFTIDKECSLYDFMLYLSTLSAYVTYQNQKSTSDESDALEEFARDLKSVWSIESKVDNKDITVYSQWEVYILLSEPTNMKKYQT